MGGGGGDVGRLEEVLLTCNGHRSIAATLIVLPASEGESVGPFDVLIDASRPLTAVKPGNDMHSGAFSLIQSQSLQYVLNLTMLSLSVCSALWASR